MKKRKSKGSTLPMVIIALVVLAMLSGIIAMTIQAANAQTLRVTEFMNAKYVATSGTQLALGAYYENDGNNNLYKLFENRAMGKDKSTTAVTSNHVFENGTAQITMTGKFEPGSQMSSRYNITIETIAKIGLSEDNYKHVVEFNWETNGIRNESGGVDN